METPLVLPKIVEPFWVTFLIQTALGALTAYVAGSKLSPAVKTAAEKLITDGNALIALI